MPWNINKLSLTLACLLAIISQLNGLLLNIFVAFMSDLYNVVITQYCCANCKIADEKNTFRGFTFTGGGHNYKKNSRYVKNLPANWLQIARYVDISLMNESEEREKSFWQALGGSVQVFFS